MDELKTRDQIDEQFKWDLTKIFENDDKWSEEYDKISKDILKLSEYEGRLGESAKTLLEFTKLKYELIHRLELIFVYASLKFSQDTTDTKSQELADKAQSLEVKFSTILAFESPEILKVGRKNIEKFISEEKGLEEYRKTFEDILRYEAHTLSEKEEALLSKAGDLYSAPDDIYQMFSYADLKFDSVADKDGNMHPLSSGVFTKLLSQDDEVLRKNTFNTYYDNYADHINMLAATLKAAVKKNIFRAEVRNFKSAREAALFANAVDEKIYDNLIEAVHDKIGYLHRYMKLRKKYMGLKEQHMYDIYMPILNSLKFEIDYPQATEIIKEAIAPLGKEYQDIAYKGYHSRWVDVYETKGKRGGAFSSGVKGTYPYILLNHNKSLDSVFTCCHEMGHSMHTYLTNSHQPVQYANYSIFLAEIASTMNETLLTHYMIDNAKTKEEKLYFIDNYLESFRTTLYRQAMFAEFENIIHKYAQEGGTLNADYLNKTYYDLNKFYYGDDVVVDDKIKYEWARIPHFYYNFYVFQYSTGISCATEFARKVLSKEEGAVEKYLGFLSKGSSEYPIDILKEAGVDMTKKDPILNSLDTFNEFMDKFEELM